MNNGNYNDSDNNNTRGDYERRLRQRQYSNGQPSDRGGYERRLQDTSVRADSRSELKNAPPRSTDPRDYGDDARDYDGNARGSETSRHIRDHVASQAEMTDSEKYRAALEERKRQYAAEHPVEVKRASMSLNVKEPVEPEPSYTEPEEDEPRRKKGNALSIIIIIIAAMVFLFAGYKLYTIWQEYKAGKDDYKEVTDYAVVDPGQGTMDIDDAAEETMLQYDIPEIDFNALAAQNDDIIGWIYFKEPDISYPITVGRDNIYYLTHTYTGNVNGSGAIFADMDNASDFTDDNTIIYGHNMKNDAMFGALDNYTKEEYGKENCIFFLYTRTGGIYKYRVISFMSTTDDSYVYTINFVSDDEYNNFLTTVLKDSLYNFGADVSTRHPVMSLSTCTNGAVNGRYVLVGILEEVIEEADPQISELSFE